MIQMTDFMKSIALLVLIITAVSSCTKSETFFTENTNANIDLIEIGSWSLSDIDNLPNPRFSGFLDDGSIVVTDASLLTINQFDAEGTLIKSFGGKGRGPGEFQTMIDVHISPYGLVSAADLSSAKISLLNLSDDSIITTDFVSGWNTRTRIVENGIAIVNHPFSYMAEFPGDLQLSFFDLETKQTKEILHLELEQNETPPGQISCTFCDFRFLNDLSFYTSPRDTSYFLYHVASSGEIITTFTRSNLKPLLYSAEERQTLREQHGAALQQIGQDGDSYVAPTHKRRIISWYPDHQNRLWVLVNGEEGEPNHLDLFSQNGDYLGSLDIPVEGFHLQHLENDKILFTRISDEMDVLEAKLFIIDG